MSAWPRLDTSGWGYKPGQTRSRLMVKPLAKRWTPERTFEVWRSLCGRALLEEPFDADQSIMRCAACQRSLAHRADFVMAPEVDGLNPGGTWAGAMGTTVSHYWEWSRDGGGQWSARCGIHRRTTELEPESLVDHCKKCESYLGIDQQKRCKMMRQNKSAPPHKMMEPGQGAPDSALACLCLRACSQPGILASVVNILAVGGRVANGK